MHKRSGSRTTGVADRSAAAMSGDEYFGASEQSNFNDARRAALGSRRMADGAPPSTPTGTTERGAGVALRGAASPAEDLARLIEGARAYSRRRATPVHRALRDPGEARRAARQPPRPPAGAQRKAAGRRSRQGGSKTEGPEASNVLAGLQGAMNSATMNWLVVLALLRAAQRGRRGLVRQVQRGVGRGVPTRCATDVRRAHGLGAGASRAARGRRRALRE